MKLLIVMPLAKRQGEGERSSDEGGRGIKRERTGWSLLLRLYVMFQQKKTKQRVK